MKMIVRQLLSYPGILTLNQAIDRLSAIGRCQSEDIFPLGQSRIISICNGLAADALHNRNQTSGHINSSDAHCVEPFYIDNPGSRIWADMERGYLRTVN